MSLNITESVLDVHHWNDTLFSFKTTRSNSFRFENGEFVMIGLNIEDKRVMRAYSIVSANYDEHLEFLSIKVPDGKFTSHLQNISAGEDLFISTKAIGTLTRDRLYPGKNLYLLCSGTGLAPFMSIIKDPEIYANFDKIILAHSVRYQSELAYQHYITEILPNNEFIGEMVQQQLIYYPTVTREPFVTQKRLTTLLRSGQLANDNNMPPLCVDDDRFMLCGNQFLLKDLCTILDQKGFKETVKNDTGHYVIERAFVQR